MHDLVVRALDGGDLTQLADLFAQHTGRPADLAAFGRWVEGFPSAGAAVDDDLVGFLITCRFAPDVLEVANLLVAERHQGQGIARRLLDHVEAEAISLDYRALIVAPSELYVTRGRRADAATFYGRLGFETVYETPHTRIVVKPLAAD